MYGDRSNDHRAHLDILAAMRERKPVKARRLMAAHLRDVRAVVTGSSAG
jgi:DNA-binding GntR family transcriptional regulator